MFNLGNKSKQKLSTAHVDLKKIFSLAIRRTDVDFGISEGYRTVKKQQEYYAIGRTKEKHRTPITKVDGVRKKSKHNYNPSLAVDIYIYHPNLEVRKKIMYDKIHLGYLMGVVTSCAKELYAKGKVSRRLRSGANWDMDGIIDYDQRFDDYPHFELI